MNIQLKRIDTVGLSEPVRALGLLCLCFCAFAVSNEAAEAQPADENRQQAVLITGATTGIGRNIAERLAREGYFVYAGARKDKDMAALDALDNVRAVRLDVTVQSQIDAAVELIEGEGRGLYGLVNNAGVGVIAPLIEMSEEDLIFQFDVNVYGPYRVTRAFAPLLIESRGRVTTIGSISGVLSGRLFGAYSMSKHAIEAYTDSLAREMQEFGVDVSVIEPGNYRSRFFQSLLQRMKEHGYSADGSLYEEEMQRMMESDSDDWGTPPDAVADAALHALFAENPQRRYMVVPNQRQAEITIRKLIEEMVQMNAGHQFSYDRDQLVGMLDEALAGGDE